MREQLQEWLEVVISRCPEISALASRSPADQDRTGYRHTLREILQQPVTWLDTAGRASGLKDRLRDLVHAEGSAPRPVSILLTGSGSSCYAGECLAPMLQSGLQIPVRAVAAGNLIAHSDEYAPRGTGSLLISLARSGDSPESAVLVERFLKEHPPWRQLLITCNERGRLAAIAAREPEVVGLVLHESTNDRSLVMTSSFTSMVMAAAILAYLDRPEHYRSVAGGLSRVARDVILRDSASLSRVGKEGFRFAAYLGSSVRFGAAREASLKMMEMTAGQVRTMAETFLGLRHGPMAAIHRDTLVVAFLSTDPRIRGLELDLLAEIRRKDLGRRYVLVGENIPAEFLREGDLGIECACAHGEGDDRIPVIEVLAGQWLAFWRCLSLGMRPDAPSPDGVIQRVVADFRI